MTSVPLILAIPDFVLEEIFSFLSYDEVAKNRMVCSKFNQIGGKLLTRGFLQVERRHNAIYKRMKSKLPRRESERRAHPLARHCDILSAVETRLSMLSMTYMKYMGSNVCCFIPGKVLDEIDRILTLVEKESVDPPPRTHELLQELRDISSMALEHFDEVILPRLKPKFERSNFFQVASSSKTSKMPLVQQVIADEIHKVRKQAKYNKHQISSVMEILKKFGTKVKRQSRLIREKSIKIREQERKLQEQAAKIEQQETSIADLKKHVDEWDQKFSDLTAELIRAREDLISKSVPPPVISPLPRSDIITRPIRVKPRSALPKYYFNLPRVEVERKRKNEPFSDIPYKMPRVTGLASSISDDIYYKINENITCNISKNITDNLNKTNDSSDSSNVADTSDKGFVSKKEGFGPFLSSSIEMILNAPINSIKSRKRKISEDIDLK